VKPLCVVFDLDDTLYLERDYVWSGFSKLAPWAKATLGISDFHLKAWALFVQGVRGHIFDHVLVAAGVRPDQGTVRAMVDMYREHVPDIQLTVDAANCLREIRRQAHAALISDGPEQSQRNKVKALGIEERFEKIVLTASLGSEYSKPHVKSFLDVQRHFGKGVEEYIYVADNPTKDFVGPRSLGWKTMRIRRPEGLYQSLEADLLKRADVETRDLNLLISTISRK
jgi:putative hydrolase of the HAD superfamily